MRLVGNVTACGSQIVNVHPDFMLDWLSDIFEGIGGTLVHREHQPRTLACFFICLRAQLVRSLI